MRLGRTVAVADNHKGHQISRFPLSFLHDRFGGSLLLSLGRFPLVLKHIALRWIFNAAGNVAYRAYPPAARVSLALSLEIAFG